jgi:hypothetical protein
MAATLRIKTVADSISKLDVDGLVIRDIDNIKVKPEQRLSVLIPEAEYITDLVTERCSFGGASAMWDVYYTLNYRLLYKPLGTGRTMTLEQINGLVGMVGKIWDAVLGVGVMAGCEDITLNSISSFGPVDAPDSTPSDPHAWWGCLLGFRILEQIR